MSQENVEIVRAAIDSINRRDINQALKAAHEDCEADWSNSIGPLGGVYRGREEVQGLFEAFLEAWEEFRWETKEIIMVDEARVLVVNRVRGRGRSSGVTVDAIGAQLWTITGGKAKSITLYQSKAEALEAAGLSE
jgi:ketosteroid isomerase-like protein